MELEIEFRQKLYKLYEENKRVLIPKDEYNNFINEIIEGSACSKKSPHQYYLLKKYEILKCGDVEKLIRKRQHPDEHPTYFVTIEETFDIVKRVHLATGHGGRDKMVKEANRKYANITQDVLSLYKSMCVECHRKRKRPTTKGVVVRPLISKDFNSRAQVDLIDMQAMNQGHFKWIMVYQDHLTKFCVLRALTSKRASEVAYQLLDIFLLLGAPCVLQSDNGSEFTAKIIVELKELWPDLVMVHGKPRHPQSQGSVERANCDIKDMLVAWLGDNNTTDWTVGIKFVQFQKNANHHSGIKCSPFAALLGTDAKIGLTSSSLPHDILSNLQSEDDLLATVTQTSTQSAPAPDATQPTSKITPVPRETTPSTQGKNQYQVPVNQTHQLKQDRNQLNQPKLRLNHVSKSFKSTENVQMKPRFNKPNEW